MKVYVVVLVDGMEYINVGGIFTSYEKAEEYEKTIIERFDCFIEEQELELTKELIK